MSWGRTLGGLVQEDFPLLAGPKRSALRLLLPPHPKGMSEAAELVDGRSKQGLDSATVSVKLPLELPASGMVRPAGP